ncbi:hypothetical protein BC827DRAFT_1375028 [Russula dissimulans]|nr:hypothetical protein BC827DRAFT_1375028 [Russula dissimulans]
MSQTIYNDTYTSISDLFGDGPLFTAPLETTTGLHYPRVSLPPFLGLSGATPGYRYDLVQSVESPPPVIVSGHGLRSDEHPQDLTFTGPYSAMDNPNYPPLASYTSNVGIDDLPHPTTGLAGHYEDQTQDGGHHIPIGPGPPRLEYYSPMTPDLNNDDLLGHMPLVDNVAGPSQRSPSPMRSRMSDDENEDLKRLASQYLNNADSYVSDIRVRRRRSGGRKISIILEIDD